eukprot:NODE_2553_length_2190_cov_4.013088.p1 GENE.NODE_2553_length_2190_cov_4.013088~~NODE_2553_length_2190_cov_4.013088.p1  ORF type:complete len:657 (+),score=176.93 NODE_2553_length_2190_cov_4.013088:280-1971(+)
MQPGSFAQPQGDYQQGYPEGYPLDAQQDGMEGPLSMTMVVPEKAMAGMKLRCTAPDGQELRLTVPDGVPPGSVMTLTQDPISKQWKCMAEPPDLPPSPQPDMPAEAQQDQMPTEPVLPPPGAMPAPPGSFQNASLPAAGAPLPPALTPDGQPIQRQPPPMGQGPLMQPGTYAPPPRVMTYAPLPVNLSYVPAAGMPAGPAPVMAVASQPGLMPPTQGQFVGAAAPGPMQPVLLGGTYPQQPVMGPPPATLSADPALFNPPRQQPMSGVLQPEQRASYTAPPMTATMEWRPSYTPPPGPVERTPSYSAPPQPLMAMPQQPQRTPSYTPPPQQPLMVPMLRPQGVQPHPHGQVGPVGQVAPMAMYVRPMLPMARPLQPGEGGLSASLATLTAAAGMMQQPVPARQPGSLTMPPGGGQGVPPMMMSQGQQPLQPPQSVLQQPMQQWAPQQPPVQQQHQQLLQQPPTQTQTQPGLMGSPPQLASLAPQAGGPMITTLPPAGGPPMMVPPQQQGLGFPGQQHPRPMQPQMWPPQGMQPLQGMQRPQMPQAQWFGMPPVGAAPPPMGMQ